MATYRVSLLMGITTTWRSLASGFKCRRPNTGCLDRCSFFYSDIYMHMPERNINLCHQFSPIRLI